MEEGETRASCSPPMAPYASSHDVDPSRRVAVSGTQMWAPASLLSRSFVLNTEQLPISIIAASAYWAVSDSLLGHALAGLEPGGGRLDMVPYQRQLPLINLFLGKARIDIAPDVYTAV